MTSTDPQRRACGAGCGRDDVPMCRSGSFAQRAASSGPLQMAQLSRAPKIRDSRNRMKVGGPVATEPKVEFNRLSVFLTEKATLTTLYGSFRRPISPGGRL